MHGDLILPIKESRDDILISILLLVAACFAVGVPTVLVAGLCCRYLQSGLDRRVFIVFSLVSLVGGGFGLAHIADISRAMAGEFVAMGAVVSNFFIPTLHYPIDFKPFATVSVLTLPLAPFLGGAMDFFKKLERALRTGDTVDDKLAYSQEQEAQRQRQLEMRAKQQAGREPKPAQQPELFLGTMMRGDSLPTRKQDSIDLHQRGNWIVLEDGLLNEHMFILGATGAGKSTSLLRLCAEILKNTDRDLIIVDGKGEEELAQQIRTLVWQHRQHDTPIFRLGGMTAGARYHAFCGHADAIYNRILKMLNDGKVEGGAAYFLDKNRNLLQLICRAPGGPPRSFTQLRQRLSLRWLIAAYAGNAEEKEYILSRKPDDIDGLAERVLPLIRELKDVTSSTGFTLEETRTAVFSIKTLAIGDTAQRFCRFLIEDFKDFVTNRASRRGFLGIDEFGVFGNDNIRDLLSQARSKQYGVSLLTQDYANLGDDKLARQILANTRTKILMGTDYPEEVGTPAGTRLQVESGIQSNELGPTGMMTSRIQHAFKVDMNTVRRFSQGQSFIIRKGYAVAVQVSPVSLPEDLVVPPEQIEAPEPAQVELPPPAEEAQTTPAQTSPKRSQKGTAKRSHPPRTSHRRQQAAQTNDETQIPQENPSPETTKNENADVQQVPEIEEKNQRKRRSKPL